jgi:hypothetical protein
LICGFGFAACLWAARLYTLPIAVASILLFHSIMVRFGISPRIIHRIWCLDPSNYPPVHYRA